MGGYTLPMMVTYSLLAPRCCRACSTMTSMAWQLAGEVREGQFSKYLVHPVSVAAYFIERRAGPLDVPAAGQRRGAAAVERGLLGLAGAAGQPAGSALAGAACCRWGRWCMLLLNHCIALLSLKFVDVTGFMIGKGTLIEFLSGALDPAEPAAGRADGGLRFTPFYYVVYYPANLVLGKQTLNRPLLAVVVLLGWCADLLRGLSEAWFRARAGFTKGWGSDGEKIWRILAHDVDSAAASAGR